MELVVKYVLFAMVATAANLLTQDLVLRVYHANYQILLSMLIGTIVGLVVKYVLDKKYIFYFQTENVLRNGQTFIKYSMIGAVLTLIFWGFEIGFEMIFNNKTMRFVGAVIGLAIGYYLKYRLDRKFVFKKNESV